MKIYDRRPAEHADERRKFPVIATSCADLRPGTLVCLRNETGALLIGRQRDRGAWELTSLRHSDSSKSLPAEALFVVLRRGSQVGLQCLG